MKSSPPQAPLKMKDFRLSASKSRFFRACGAYPSKKNKENPYFSYADKILPKIPYADKSRIRPPHPQGGFGTDRTQKTPNFSGRLRRPGNHVFRGFETRCYKVNLLFRKPVASQMYISCWGNISLCGESCDISSSVQQYRFGLLITNSESDPSQDSTLRRL